MRDTVLGFLNPDGYDYLFTIMRNISLPLKESEVDLYVESWANTYGEIAKSNGESNERIERIKEQINDEYAIFKVVMKVHYGVMWLANFTNGLGEAILSIFFIYTHRIGLPAFILSPLTLHQIALTSVKK